ncbi:MAG: YbaK/EbsC family protein [Thermodesulfobacteriota bacterium]|nr:YbaK/EbsC family protein [Thermodesulfobacteriota bacterium]
MSAKLLLDMEVKRLEEEVISCKAAATAKGVPLKNELKTLILDTSIGTVALHIRGDRSAALRKVKNRLRCKEAYLSSPARLRELGAAPGTVHPFRSKIWGLKHLISKSLLTLKYLTTNSGTLTEYVKFSPVLLLFARDKIVDDFEM